MTVLQFLLILVHTL